MAPSNVRLEDCCPQLCPDAIPTALRAFMAEPGRTKSPLQTRRDNRHVRLQLKKICRRRTPFLTERQPDDFRSSGEDVGLPSPSVGRNVTPSRFHALMAITATVKSTSSFSVNCVRASS